jgi:hypothetical protein
MGTPGAPTETLAVEQSRLCAVSTPKCDSDSGSDLLGLAGSDQPSVGHPHNSGRTGRDLDVVRDDHDRLRTLPRDRSQELDDLLLGLRVQVPGRLVRKHDAWTVRESARMCGRSSAIRTGLGDRRGAALAPTNVATAQLHLGRLEDAGRTVRIALADGLEVGGLMVVAFSLDVCGLLALALGRAGEAARLFGAADRLHAELGSVRDVFEGQLVDASTALVRASLGEDAFAAECERGRSLSLEEAAACAYAATD